VRSAAGALLLYLVRTVPGLFEDELWTSPFLEHFSLVIAGLDHLGENAIGLEALDLVQGWL
jgi:hypothetical protein